MSRKKKIPAKEFALQKRKRRQWITFVRMCRYGVHNFSRNAWLTAAATAMMTLTLFVIMVSLIARNVLIDTTTVIRDKVDISLYIKHDAPQKELNKMQNDISKLNGVKTVTFITPQQARQDYIETNKDRPELINALNIAILIVLKTTNEDIVIRTILITSPIFSAKLTQRPILSTATRRSPAKEASLFGSLYFK